MNRLLLLMLGFTLMMTSCSKDEEVPTSATLTVRYTLNYDGQPLVFNQNLAYGADFIRMEKFAYFLTNLKIRNGQDSIKLADLSFIDYTKSNQTLAQATAGLVLSIPNVKTGTYSSIEFGVGLPKDLNATKPADYTSANPLGDLSYYWAGWNGYIFSKMEGKYDSLSTGTFTEGFTFHTGIDENYKIVKLNTPFTVDGNKTNNEVHVSLDVKKLFVKNGSQIDVKVENSAHGPANAELIRSLTNNYNTAFKLQ